MMKILMAGLSLLVSLSALANPNTCIQPLRNTLGLNPASLQDSYLLRIHKTLAGELDPYVLGDGGIVTATWLAGVRASPTEANIFFVIFESDSEHLNTTKITKSYYKGSLFLLIKANCLAAMQNEKQMRALHTLVTSLMNPPRNSQFKFYNFLY